MDFSILFVLFAFLAVFIVFILSSFSEAYPNHFTSRLYHAISNNLLKGVGAFFYRNGGFILILSVMLSIIIEVSDLAYFATVRTETHSSHFIYWIIGGLLCLTSGLSFGISTIDTSNLDSKAKALMSYKAEIGLKIFNIVLILVLLTMAYILHIRYFIDNIELVALQIKRYNPTSPEYLQLIAKKDELNKAALLGYYRIINYGITSVAQIIITLASRFINNLCKIALNTQFSNENNKATDLSTSTDVNDSAKVTTKSIVPASGYNSHNNLQVLFDTFFNEDLDTFNKYLSNLKHNGNILDPKGLTSIFSDLHNRDKSYTISEFKEDFGYFSEGIKALMVRKSTINANIIKDINRMYFNNFSNRYPKYTEAQKENFFSIA